jgi:ATP-dependent Lon protease
MNKRREEESRKKKQSPESSDDDSSYTEDGSEEEMDVHEYRKFLKNIFPSKHLDKKIKAGDRVRRAIKEEVEEGEDTTNYTKNLRSNKTTTKKKTNDESVVANTAVGKTIIGKKEKVVSSPTNKKNSTKKIKPEERDESVESCSSGSEYDDSSVSYSDSVSASESDSESDAKPKAAGKFNIIFTIGEAKHRKNKEDDDEDEEEDDDEEEWSTCSDSEETENEDDPISSDTETEADNNEYETTTEKQKKRIAPTPVVAKDNKEIVNKLKNMLGLPTSESSPINTELVTVLKELEAKNKDNSLVKECLRVCNEKMETDKKKQAKKTQKEKARNGRIFKRILRDKNTMNDYEFYERLEPEQQKKIIKELREINKLTRIEKPYRLTLLEADMPLIFKAAAMKKISSLRYMDSGSGEFYKVKNWVDTFMRIPFGRYNTLPITIANGVEMCHEFMANAQKVLDDAVYGLNDAKLQIMQMLGQLITNPTAIGSAIAIHGPPGTGKTSLVKEGISKILNRPFAFIALGGATDSSFLEGHSYTYEGSVWGKIVQILIDSKCMNPVIYFDELDKISDTPKGEEIAGILTHLTDTSQNSQFHDKYFAEVDFDLSKCLFIFSYNDESKVNAILKDRMYRIQTKGYNQKQKTAISNNYLLPRLRDQVKFTEQDIIIPESTLHYLIDNHCLKEDGVRNLKRCLEIIYTKLNLYRLMRPGSNLFEEDMSLKVEFPLTVTKEIVDKLIKKTDSLNPSLYYLYI